MNVYLGDIHKFITFDGIEFIIPNGTEISMIAYGGYGAPPTDWITRRGYKQDGMTELGFQLSQRSISVEIRADRHRCTRAEYWQFRKELNDYLRPNRGGPIIMQVIQINGIKRALTVRANPGFILPPISPDENDWAITENLEFIAFNPLWFDPDQSLNALAGGYGTDLVFPITFDAGHIIFGPSGLIFSKTFTYAGTWKSYPKFIIDGPYDGAIIENETTGVEIFLNIPIALGEQRILDLTPGNQSLVDANGVNCFGDLGPNSNLVDFCIEADPIAPGGINLITVILIGSHGSAYYNLIEYDRPYRYYRFGELVGTDALDSGIQGASGTYTGGYTLQQPGALVGDSNTAVVFNGTTGYMAAPTLNLSNISFSIEGWFKVNSLVPAIQSFFDVWSDYVLHKEFGIWIYADGHIKVTFYGDDLDSAAGIIISGTWYYAVVTYNFIAGTATLYINGVNVGSAGIGPFIGTNPLISIGVRGDYTLGGPYLFFDGNIDEVSVYLGTVLTQTQITEHYAARLNAFSSGAELDFYSRYFAI